MKLIKFAPAFFSAIALAIASVSPASADEEKPIREWTLLVFMNGNNNLDQFGDMDLNEMEKVGSTDQVNVVVQWASYQRGTVQRVLVGKDDNEDQVSSPVIEDMGEVDMGDWNSLVDFVKWGAENFPAKHYFVDVWDHGSGWHKIEGNWVFREISHDDLSGNFITTEQLGRAMRDISNHLGQKVDLYGSDACLMAMAEVAGEMSTAVSVFAGSEELEPGPGWPYDALLARWTERSREEGGVTAQEVGKILTEEFVKSYDNGSQGDSEVTFSVFDLAYFDDLNKAVSGLGAGLQKLNSTEKGKARTAASKAQKFYFSDYRDLGDFVKELEKAKIGSLGTESLTAVKTAMADFVVANLTSTAYSRAQGLAIWLPTERSEYNQHLTRYKGLEFHKATGWGTAVGAILP